MARVIDLKNKKEEVIAEKVAEVTEPEKKPEALPMPAGTLRWTAPAQYRRVGTRAPYVFALLLGIAALLIAVFQRDPITTALFALMAVMIVVHVRKPVGTVDIEINSLAIKLAAKSYPHEQTKSFWIQYQPEYGIKELSLQLKRRLSSYVKIQLGDTDPVQVRAILLEFIPETPHEETLVHSAIRWLGL